MSPLSLFRLLPDALPNFLQPGSTSARFLAALGLLCCSGLTALPAQDSVVLKNGRKAECRVLDFTAEALKISYQPTPGAAAAERLVPFAEVDYVELAPLPGETEALAQAVREGRAEPLVSFWIKRLPWLNRPRTNAGEIGLVYAELLSRLSTADRMERALKIYSQIEAADWDPGRRGRAQAGRLRVMLRQGRVEEVRPLAEGLLEKSGDPRVLIELRHVMAEAASASLTQLEKDHPRWQEEDELVPRHTQLLNDAMDGYLFPHLFHGAGEDLAARGLWAAAQLSAAQKDLPQATDWSTDLTNLYPGTPEAAAAQAWLAKQPAPTLTPSRKAQATSRTGGTEGESEAETGESAEEPPEPEAQLDEPKPKSKSTAKSKPKAKPKASKKPAVNVKEEDADE
jgi:hypothetical protein